MQTKLSKIFEITQGMSSLSRYSQTHLIKEESVLEHTGFVCLLSYFIGNELRYEGYQVDLELLLCKSVVHDIDEIITGDIPRPTKYFNPEFRAAVQAIEEKNMKNISNDLGIPLMFRNWVESKEGKEGFIVALCDCLAVVYKVWYEAEMFGNKTIIDHAYGMEETLNKISSMEKFDLKNSNFLHSIIEDAKMLCIAIQTGAKKK